jgi:hypothetical protein
MSGTSTFISFAKVAVASPNLKWEDFWLYIHGFWLEITEKIGQPCTFFLALDVADLSGAFQETSIHNSLSLTIRSRAGDVHLFLQSTNRCDIIQLFNALQTARALLTQALEHSSIPQSCVCAIETPSGFFGIGKSKFQLKETAEAFELTGPKGSIRYAFEDVQSVHARLNHASANTRFVINVKENGSVVAKEYNCLKQEDLMNVIQCFLMNSFIWARDNAAPAVPIAPMNVLAIE